MNIYSITFDTPIGTLQCLAHAKALLLVAFCDYKNLSATISTVLTHTQGSLVNKTTPLLQEAQRQILAYYAGTLQTFTLPLDFIGTPFQEAVWKNLIKVPYSTAWSYAQLATLVGNPKAFRAVASANARNKFAIVVPCHRIINADGSLGGYASGLERKQWLLQHEAKNRIS